MASNLARLPAETWSKILDLATYIPDLADIHPSKPSSPFVISPEDVSIDEIRASLRLCTSFSQVCRWFKELLTTSFLYDTILVTDDNAHHLAELLSRTTALDQQVRVEASTYSRSRAIRHMVVDIRLGPSTDVADLESSLAKIALHVPNIISFTSILSSPFLAPVSLKESFLDALCRVPANSLRKIVFRGSGRPIFAPHMLETLFSSTPNLETLIFRYTHHDPGMNVELPRTMSRLSCLSVDGFDMMVSAPSSLPSLQRFHSYIDMGFGMWPVSELCMAFSATLTHMSLSFDASFVDVELNFTGISFPVLTHLSLTGHPNCIVGLLKLWRPFPAAHHISLSLLHVMCRAASRHVWMTESFTPRTMRNLILHLSTIAQDLPSLETVRFAEAEMVGIARRMLETCAQDGGQVDIDIEQLWGVPFAIEDCVGGSFREAVFA